MSEPGDSLRCVLGLNLVDPGKPSDPGTQLVVLVPDPKRQSEALAQKTASALGVASLEPRLSLLHALLDAARCVLVLGHHGFEFSELGCDPLAGYPRFE